jgi:hypothetical protein
MAAEPTSMFLTLSTVVTTAPGVAGTGASTPWFPSVLRRLGLRHRQPGNGWPAATAPGGLPHLALRRT